jgi:phosphoglycerate dehydrogenase-like enzyme
MHDARGGSRRLSGCGAADGRLERTPTRQALCQGTIAGAALDVYDEEPLLLDHPLHQLPNTVITPHLGYVTVEGYKVFYGHVVEDIQAFLQGKPVRVINAATAVRRS